MLTAAIDGLVDPLRPRGRAPRRGRRRRRAQAHPRLQPDPRVGARLQARARDPGHRHPAGLRHRPAGGDPGRQQDRPRPDRGRHRRRHRHHLRRAGRDQREAAQEADEGQRRHATPRAGSRRSAQIRPGDIGLDDPAERRAAHRAVDGRARRADRAGVADRPRGAGRAGRRARTSTSPRRTTRASTTTWSRRSAASSATRTCAPTPRVEKLAQAQAGLRQGRGGHDDRRQLHAADRRRLRGAAGLRGVGRGARPAGAGLPRRRTRPPRSTTCTAARAC